MPSMDLSSPHMLNLEQSSMIPWSGGGERIYAAVGGACLLQRAGELSVVEYGLDRVLQTVSFVSYGGVQLGPWWHEARVDWLELNESGHLLLFRHTRRRLALLRIDTGEKEIIGSGVSFVQWIETSDAVVAQTPTHLLIWYSVWEPQCVDMSECVSVSAVSVSERRVLLEGGQIQAIVLDEHRLAFNSALRSGDLKDCAQYLDAVSRSADVGSLWCQLAEQALTGYDVEI
ncbi:unnamed protein product [Danaus chrysippus]|uniref:(African queen) hypothetical protein n=1 Tax=Danaus chrysippus TaxID=151541 RepID=A0A8J2R3U2_9NEOP|nr:unnamed protein product [Danaus chrysippus]